MLKKDASNLSNIRLLGNSHLEATFDEKPKYSLNASTNAAITAMIYANARIFMRKKVEDLLKVSKEVRILKQNVDSIIISIPKSHFRLIDFRMHGRMGDWHEELSESPTDDIEILSYYATGSYVSF